MLAQLALPAQPAQQEQVVLAQLDSLVRLVLVADQLEPLAQLEPLVLAQLAELQLM